jgi:hypothetical protein
MYRPPPSLDGGGLLVARRAQFDIERRRFEIRSQNRF